MGISENQIRNAAQMKTRRMEDKANTAIYAEKEALLEKANAAKANAKPGSMAAKANMVKEFNERNNKK
jgi:YidC/Oxa1 family membrane protein insertase